MESDSRGKVKIHQVGTSKMVKCVGFNSCYPQFHFLSQRTLDFVTHEPEETSRNIAANRDLKQEDAAVSTGRFRSNIGEAG